MFTKLRQEFLPADFVLLRVAALPLDAQANDPVASLADPWFLEAITYASPSLAERVSNATANPSIRAPLRRYLARMSSRATPFGLFSAVGLGRVGKGANSTLRIPGPEAFRRYATVDLGTLYRCVARFSEQKENRAHLRYRWNPTALDVGYAFRVVQRFGDARTPALAQVASDEAARFAASTFGSRPLSFDAFTNALVEHFDCAPDEASAYAHALADAELIIPVASPPSISDAPARHVATELARSAGTRKLSVELECAMRACDGISGSPLTTDRTSAIAAARAACSLLDASTWQSRFHVDLTLDAPDLELGREVLDDVRDAATMILARQLRARSAENETESAFAARFRERHGEGFVPLPQVLNAEAMTSDDAYTATPSHGGLQVDRELLRAYGDALRTETDVELDEGALVDGLPDLDLEAIGALFQLTRGANVGRPERKFVVVMPAITVGSTASFLGRFTSASRELLAAVHRATSRESDATDALVVDISVLPRGDLANPHAHPPIHAHYIELDPAEPSHTKGRIALAELEVAMRGNKIHLRRAIDRRPVKLRPGSNINPAHPDLSPQARFLWRSACQEELGGTFGWGGLSHARALPRVWFRNVLVLPARWSVTARDVVRNGRFDDEGLAAYVDAQQIPARVSLCNDDKIFPVDLSSAEGRADVLRIFRERESRGWAPSQNVVTLQETIDCAVIHSPRGHHVGELFLPLIRAPRPQVVGPLADGHRAQQSRRDDVDGTYACARNETILHPGSSVVYIKVYAEAKEAQAALAVLARTAEELTTNNSLVRWTFLRHEDPLHHIRFRAFARDRVSALAVQQTLLASIQRLVDQGAIWRVQFDTYVREVERYGGHLGIQLAEALFAIDSCAAEACTRELAPQSPERVLLVGTAALALLRAFRVSSLEAVGFLRRRVEAYRMEFGASVLQAISHESKELKERWRDVVLGASSSTGHAVYAGAAHALSEVASQFLRAQSAQAISIDRDQALASYIHMNAARIIVSDLRFHEAVAVGLLGRAIDEMFHRNLIDRELRVNT